MWQALFSLAANCTPRGFFGLAPWYKYLTVVQNSVGVCEPQVQFITNGHLDLTVLVLISLGVLDMVLRLAGLVAVGFVIYGGILYVTSEGQSDKAKKALDTIVNSLIGLGITIVAASSVAFIGKRLAGSATVNSAGLPELAAGNGQIQAILEIFFGILAVGALLVIVLSGFNYVTAAGDPSSMSRSKNRIIYASIGLVVCMAAFSIVAFVLNNV